MTWLSPCLAYVGDNKGFDEFLAICSQFLGRAPRSRDGFMESCTCRRAGHPSPTYICLFLCTWMSEGFLMWHLALFVGGLKLEHKGIRGESSFTQKGWGGWHRGHRHSTISASCSSVKKKRKEKKVERVGVARVFSDVYFHASVRTTRKFLARIPFLNSINSNIRFPFTIATFDSYENLFCFGLMFTTALFCKGKLVQNFLRYRISPQSVPCKYAHFLGWSRRSLMIWKCVSCFWIQIWKLLRGEWPRSSVTCNQLPIGGGVSSWRNLFGRCFVLSGKSHLINCSCPYFFDDHPEFLSEFQQLLTSCNRIHTVLFSYSAMPKTLSYWFSDSRSGNDLYCSICLVLDLGSRDCKGNSLIWIHNTLEI